MHSVCRDYFLARTMRRGGRGILDYVPFWGHRASWMDQTAQCTTRSCILQNKTIIRPLRHSIGFLKIFSLSPPVGPQGSGLDQNCTCTTRPWDQQHETINRSLWYLVTEGIEEQDIVYGQTDRRPDERVSYKLDWSLTNRAKNGTKA